MSEIQKSREIINNVDREMARLFELRMEAARQIGLYKKEKALPIDDFDRETEIINRNSGYIENEEYRSYYVNFLKNNIKISKDLQHRIQE